MKNQGGITGPNQHTVPRRKFHFEYGPRINRFWNHETQTGIGYNQLKDAPFSITDISHIFVRNDGWVIACTPAGFETCYNLWPESWREIVVRETK